MKTHELLEDSQDTGMVLRVEITDAFSKQDARDFVKTLGGSYSEQETTLTSAWWTSLASFGLKFATPEDLQHAKKLIRRRMRGRPEVIFTYYTVGI
ncbi:hypothetical protein LCGC14_1315260 [marine sediment metagenome]|uniref:Uncharacterized protein n=1 Tax=marine sediment metagenome TaxID=412755 RepID=A0A0F9NNK4_9ZZZZ